MNLGIAAAFLSLYAIYIILVVIEQRNKHNKKKKNNKKQSMLQNESSSESDSESKGIQEKMDDAFKVIQQEEESQEAKPNKNPYQQLLHFIRVFWKFVFYYGVPPYSHDSWKPQKAVISLIAAPFTCALSYGFIDSFTDKLFSIPFIVWFSIPALLFLSHSIYCIIHKETPQHTIFYSVYTFIIVICWLTVICGMLINLLELLQLLTNINSVFLGLSILAWANCVGDYLSITAFAKKGYASTAVAGIFSGQLFNFLLGFGLSLFIRSLRGQYEFAVFDFEGNAFDKVSDSIIMAVIAMSVFYMLWVFYQVKTNQGTLGVGQSRFSMSYYIVFLLVALVLSVSTDFLRELQCDLSL